MEIRCAGRTQAHSVAFCVVRPQVLIELVALVCELLSITQCPGGTDGSVTGAGVFHFQGCFSSDYPLLG